MMSNVLNFMNESFNRKLKEFHEPKKGSPAQIKDSGSDNIEEALDDNNLFDLQSDVYNALAKIAFKYHKKGIDLSEGDLASAFEHFTIRFFEDGGIDDMYEAVAAPLKKKTCLK